MSGMQKNFENLQKIPENIVKEVSKPKNNMGIILLFVIILFVVAFNVYRYYTKRAKQTTNTDNTTAKQAELLLFYTDWCPHCTSAKPEWNSFKEEYKTKEVNGFKITFNEINCTKETPESESMMEKYKVEGYPTIKLVAKNKVFDFDAKPSKQNLTQFVNTALN